MNQIKHFFLLVILAFLALSCCQTQPKKTVDNAAIIEKKIDSLLSKMTIEEKIGQMSQVRHFWDIKDGDIKKKYIGSIIHTQGEVPGITAKEWQSKMIQLQKEALSTRLKIPLLIGVDAVHGQNTFEGATIFPHNIGMAATRNTKLIERASSITAIEAQATGFNWTFSPCAAIPFNEKWGRVYEAFSESSKLTTEYTIAAIKGYQANLRADTTVLATAKHYIGDGATDYGVEGGNTTIPEHQINEILLPPYREAIKAGVGAIMASFNSTNDINMHAHKAFITDTLKNKMGFSGMLITDWKGYSRFGGYRIINAGIDMVMAVDGDLDYFQKNLKLAVDSGKVSIERIDDAVERILRQKFRLGLFENPFPDTSLSKKIGIRSHREIARQAVRESIVLLKNNDQALPLSKQTKKIVVVGEHADNSGLQSGGWTVNWQGNLQSYRGATTILDGIREQYEGVLVYDTTANQPQLDADVAIIVVGETPYAEFFGDINEESKYQLHLTAKHKKYIETYKDKVSQLIILLVSGRPLIITDELLASDAFVALWLIGSEGEGVAEVLFGDYNFKGKLPHTWPLSLAQFDGLYGPNYWDKNPEYLFPLGYGLSYR
jgi:beta-glucosidase